MGKEELVRSKLESEKRFQENRIKRLEERKEQIFNELYTSTFGDSIDRYNIRCELAELDAKIKMAHKQINFINELLIILK